MANIVCTIDGIASSAYRKPGADVGTVPTIPRKVDNTYKIVFTPDFSAWQRTYLSAYPNDGADGIVSAEILSGDSSWWEDSSYFDSIGSFSAYTKIDSSAEYVYVQPGDPYYPSDISFTFNGSSGYYGDGTSNYKWYISSTYPTLTAPSDLTVKQDGKNYVVTWTAAKGSYSSGSVEYRVTVGDEIYSTTSTQLTIPVPSSYYDKSIRFYVNAYYAGRWDDLEGYTGLETGCGSVYFTAYSGPKITTQPSITSISPSSGKSTKITWSVASVVNQGSATIYYQYFVGPSSTYSDSYHVGTTTGLSATISEANILAKCGSNFSGTCYIFVRAYWQLASDTGGWSTPSGSTFTYRYMEWTNKDVSVSQVYDYASISWNEVKSVGVSNISYILKVSDGSTTIDVYSGTGTSATFNMCIDFDYWYDKNLSFYVIASGSGVSNITSNTKSITIKGASFSSPPKIHTITYKGGVLTIKWDAAKVMNAASSYTVAYALSFGPYEVISPKPATALEMIVSDTKLDYGVEYNFYIWAFYYSDTNDYTIESSTDNFKFTPINPKLHSTIRFWNGKMFTQATVLYWNGSEFVECTNYYWNGKEFVRCSY